MGRYVCAEEFLRFRPQWSFVRLPGSSFKSLDRISFLNWVQGMSPKEKSDAQAEFYQIPWKVSDFNESNQEVLFPTVQPCVPLVFSVDSVHLAREKNSRFPSDRRKNIKCCCRQLATTHYFLWNMFLWFDFWVIAFLRRTEGVSGWQDRCFVWGSQHTARLLISLLGSLSGLSLVCGSWVTCFKGCFINPPQQVSKTRFKYNRGLFLFGFTLIVFSQ